MLGASFELGKMTFDTTKVERLVKAALKNVDPAGESVTGLMEQIGATQIKRMDDRLKKGQGINGQFDGYSDRYAKYRAEKGRQTSPVDLTFSGAMRASMNYRITRPGCVEIGGGAGGLFRAHWELAARHDQGWGVTQREFIGYTGDDIMQHRERVRGWMLELGKEEAQRRMAARQ